MTATIRSFLRISVRWPGGEVEPVEIGDRRVAIAHGDRGQIRVGVGEDEEAHGHARERCHVFLLRGRNVDHMQVPLLVAVLVLGKQDAPAVRRPAIEHIPTDVERLESAAPALGDRPRRIDGVDRGHEEVERTLDRPQERDPAAIRTDLWRQVCRRGQQCLERDELGFTGGWRLAIATRRQQGHAQCGDSGRSHEAIVTDVAYRHGTAQIQV